MPIKLNKEGNTMLTLEKVKKESTEFQKGSKLVCYEAYYGFIRTYPYHVHDVTDEGYYVVLDCDKMPVIFSKEKLKKHFMPR